jgi:large subunit ribosomal protein L24e
MVKTQICSYCGEQIPPGEGLMYVRTNGEIFHFCSKKCRKLQIVFKKPARKVRWTKFFGEK